MFINMRQRAKGDQEDGCMGSSSGVLTTKIHEVVHADCRPICFALTADQADDGHMRNHCYRQSPRVRSCLPTRLTITKLYGDLQSNARHGLILRLRAIGGEAILSANGFTGNVILLSVYSANSNSSELSPPVTIKT